MRKKEVKDSLRAARSVSSAYLEKGPNVATAAEFAKFLQVPNRSLTSSG